MATTRKPGSKSLKPKKPTRKAASTRPAHKAAPAKRGAAKPARAGAAAKARPQKPVAKPAQAAKPAKVAKPVKAAKPAKGVKPGAPAPRPLDAAAARKIAAAQRRAEAAQRVQPLGVLPPGARARAAHAAPVRPPAAPAPAKPARKPSAVQAVQRVTDKDLKEFEERLLAERQRIVKEIGHLETTVLKVNPRDSAGDLSGYSFHMADAGTDAMEREKAFLFASAEGRMLLEIDDALRRLYRGEYGMCESCGSAISRARLEAMPNARLCVNCKEKEERAGRSGQGPGQ